MKNRAGTGTLYVVGTPLGDPEDITMRALSCLRRAQLILAEHPNHTNQLLALHNVATPCIRYTPTETERYIELLEAGNNIALVSDAGVPGIADPGTALVDAAWSSGVSVDVASGISAVTSALALSGLFTHRFQFFGFPPRKSADRSEFFKEIADYNGTIVIYETKRGLRSTLRDLSRRLEPNRRILLAGGITTARASYMRGTVADINSHDYLDVPVRYGPFTVVIEQG